MNIHVNQADSMRGPPLSFMKTRKALLILSSVFLLVPGALIIVFALQGIFNEFPEVYRYFRYWNTSAYPASEIALELVPISVYTALGSLSICLMSLGMDVIYTDLDALKTSHKE